MNAANRSMVLQGAATSHCAEPTLLLERPMYEEKQQAGNSSKVCLVVIYIYFAVVLVIVAVSVVV
jgi:hypothetical protein